MANTLTEYAQLKRDLKVTDIDIVNDEKHIKFYDALIELSGIDEKVSEDWDVMEEQLRALSIPSEIEVSKTDLLEAFETLEFRILINRAFSALCNNTSKAAHKDGEWLENAQAERLDKIYFSANLNEGILDLKRQFEELEQGYTVVKPQYPTLQEQGFTKYGDYLELVRQETDKVDAAACALCESVQDFAKSQKPALMRKGM